MVFIFIFLHHHLVDALMAALFSVSKATATSIHHHLLNFLFDLLLPQLIFVPYADWVKDSK
jgi:hypothetical protein